MANQIGDLKQKIFELSNNKQYLYDQITNERQIINELEGQFLEFQKEQLFYQNRVVEKSDAINNYDKMIREAEQTLSKLQEQSTKLISALATQESKLKTQQAQAMQSQYKQNLTGQQQFMSTLKK